MENNSVKLILEEIQKSKNELFKAIEASEIRVRYEIEEHNRKIKQLVTENKELKEKVEKLEIENRKNNIVLFGLHKPIRDITVPLMCQEIRQLIGVDIEEKEINNIHCLGKGQNPPIKVELTTFLKKKDILKNCYKLKGTRYSISHDLSKTQREENKILRYFLKKEKASNKNINCYIRGNKLVIEDKEFTAEELSISEEKEEEDKQRKVVSAPNTPIPASRQLEFEEEEEEVTGAAQSQQLANSKEKVNDKIKNNKKEDILQQDSTPKSQLQQATEVSSNIPNKQNRVLRSVTTSTQAHTLNSGNKK